MREPQLEELMQRLAGWDGLAALERKMTGRPDTDHDRPHERLSQQMLSTFSTTAGRAVLEHLLDRTIRRSAIPNLSNPNMAGLTLEGLTAQVLWHQAQCAVVREIVSLMTEGAARGGDT